MTEALDREGRMGRLAVVTGRRLGESEIIGKGLGSLQTLKGLPMVRSGRTLPIE